MLYNTGIIPMEGLIDTAIPAGSPTHTPRGLMQNKVQAVVMRTRDSAAEMVSVQYDPRKGVVEVTHFRPSLPPRRPQGSTITFQESSPPMVNAHPHMVRRDYRDGRDFGQQNRCRPRDLERTRGRDNKAAMAAY